MKVAIIAIAKNENLYINEWINYHLNLGFDNIIICDNDDELILPQIIKDDRVIVEDYTNVIGVQPIAYSEMFVKYRNNYDWILFIDIDEFLFLEKHNNVKEFVSGFSDDVDVIRLNWKHYTDSDKLDVKDGNYNVLGRFPTEIHVYFDFYAKSMIRTKINVKDEDIHVTSHGIFDRELRCYDALGNKCNSGRYVKNIIHETAWINHYKTKTIGEYIRQKYFRGGPNKASSYKYKDWKKTFFETNIVREEKLKYAEELIEKYNKELK